MAKTYYVTFRLEDDSTYSQRWDRLMEAIKLQKANYDWWFEPSSFIMYQSDAGIDAIAKGLKACINPKTDIIYIGMPDYKDARVVGKVADNDIYTLVPFTKYV